MNINNMNIGSLKITAKQGVGISDIPQLPSSQQQTQNPILSTSFLKTENRADGATVSR